MRFRSALLAAGMMAASGIGGVTAAGPAHADLVTRCVGEGGAVEVPGDLVVPEGESCRLNGTTVHGDVQVQRGANLVVGDGTLDGSVEVAASAFLDADKTSIAGTITTTDAAGTSLQNSSISGLVQIRGQSDGYTYVTRSTLDAGLTATQGGVLLEDSSISGDVSGQGTLYTDLYDTELAGALTVADTENGSLVCASEIYGDAEFTGNAGVLQLGADGPQVPCPGATYWGGSLDVSDNISTTVVSDNIIRGDLSGTGNDPAPVGENNRVRGTVSGQFTHLQPPDGAPQQAAQRRDRDLQTHLWQRRSRARAEAHHTGSANLHARSDRPH